MTPSEQANIELVEEHFEAMNNRDVDRARSTLADDFEVIGAGYGPDEYLEANANNFWEPFPDWTESIEQIFAKDDMVSVRFRFTGTHEGGGFHGVPPTGAEVEGTGMYQIRVEEGEMTAIWAEWGSGVILEALDLRPSSVAEMKMHRQMLEVLLRVLRHNISNDINAITGTAGLIAAGDVDPQEYAERIQDHAESLQASATKARDIERSLVHNERTESIEIPDVIGQVVTQARQSYPNADIETTIESGTDAITCNRSTLTMVLEEVVENAIEHSDREQPGIAIEVGPTSVEGYDVEISVADNGPGIPDHEIEPIELGHENPLEHASGIGLWAVKWGIEQLEGEVQFLENEPRGSVVRFHIPSLD